MGAVSCSEDSTPPLPADLLSARFILVAIFVDQECHGALRAPDYFDVIPKCHENESPTEDLLGMARVDLQSRNCTHAHSGRRLVEMPSRQ